MMILSRIWYVILALLLAAAYYVVSLAVGQYNRRNQAASDETVRADSQVVSWALQVDARKRADTLILAKGDQLDKALGTANAPPGKEPGIPASAKDEAAKALRTFNEKLPPEYRHDALMVTDRDGRLVAQINFDQLNAAPEFELGGYPAVNDALHGFLDRVFRNALFLRLVADFMLLSACDLGSILSSPSRCGCHCRSPYGLGHRKTDADSRSSILFVVRHPRTSVSLRAARNPLAQQPRHISLKASKLDCTIASVNLPIALEDRSDPEPIPTPMSTRSGSEASAPGAG